jgi:hypothetical protein
MTSNATPGGPDPDARRDVRQVHAVPLLAKTDAERQALARTVLAKSPLGDAVRYLTNQWAALQPFPDDGRLAIDTNRAEKSAPRDPYPGSPPVVLRSAAILHPTSRESTRHARENSARKPPHTDGFDRMAARLTCRDATLKMQRGFIEAP